MKLNRSRRGGCLAQLGVGLLVVVVIAVVGVGVVAFMVRKNINKYTTDAPPPRATYTREEANAHYASLKPRIEQLFEDQKEIARETEELQAESNSTANTGTGTTGDPKNLLTIRLSPADLNALAYKSFKALPEGAQVSFSISGDRLILNTAFPFKNVPLLGGRFFVGSIELIEPPAGYPLPLYLHTVTASGETLPSGLISHFQDPANAKDFLSSNGLGDELGFVHSMHIEGGELVVSVNPKP